MESHGAFYRHLRTFKKFLVIYRFSLFRQYVLVPIGILSFMMVLYGVNQLIKNVIAIDFPASVAVMLVNFVWLCILSAFNKKWADVYISIIDIPLSWALRWMNLFFTPAFVTLPLSPWISFKEAILIAAVFIIGYITSALVLAYITIAVQKATGIRRLRSLFTRQDELDNGMGEGSKFAKNIPLAKAKSNSSDLSRVNENSSDDEIEHFNDIFAEENQEDFQLVNVATNTGVPLSAINSQALNRSESVTSHDVDSRIQIVNIPKNMEFSDHEVPKASRKRNLTLESLPVAASNTRETDSVLNDTDFTPVVCQRAMTRQFSRQVDHYFTINMWNNHLHHVLYGIALFATIFTYYFSWYIMPFQLFLAICMFMIITDAPLVPNPKYRKLLHPVICSVALFWLVSLISALIKYQEIKYFIYDIKDYKTGRNYLSLFNTNEYGSKEWPGAGDVFTSCMDVSIVGLSMPMFTYRKDLRKHFFVMIPPILLLCAASLMLYPIICHAIGISTYNSIGFVGRSITLALGTPTVQNLNGSVTIMAVTTVLSGVIGALSGGPMLDLMKVPENDYVTRGLTLGCNCGAIATAYLLSVDRRAAAISSLSFVLFGTFMVILSSIGSIQSFVNQLASM